MFEWLERELSSIKSRKFHLISADSPEGCASKEIEWPCSPPPSYQAFIERFGCVFLYRESNYYLIRVFSKPVLVKDKKGIPFLEFGGYDSGRACYRASLLQAGRESPVFETRGVSGLFQTATSFEEWLSSRRIAARKHYNRHEWENILNGPAPFSLEEEAIVEARKEFSYKIIGIAADRDILFEVHSGSTRLLPFLTLGVKAPNLIGGICLPVGTIYPGETGLVKMNVYKQIVDPKEVEVRDKPDPLPEDRELYGEFKKEF